MNLQHQIKEAFIQISEAITQLSDEQYTHKSALLAESSIGQHVRHTIEFFVCLLDGYEVNEVNYDARKRDYTIETDRTFATGLLQNILIQINKPNKPLSLKAFGQTDLGEPIIVSTNFERELLYNLEHAVHHMALIRVGIAEVSAVALPASFGVSSATLKHRTETCVQ